MQPKAKRLLLVMAVFAASWTGQAADTPLLIEFSGRRAALASAVSASGTVAGSLNDGGGFHWTSTRGTVFIGGLAATAISLDGRTIVGSARDARGIRQAAFWLRAAEWQLLGALRPDVVPCQESISGATGTSDDGRVIVGAANNGTASNACGAGNHAFRWEESTGMVDLGSTVAGEDSAASDVSGDGHVVVGHQDDSIGQSFGVRWVEGRQEPIPPVTALPRAFVGPAHATNHDGSIVVGEICRPFATEPVNSQSAWIWTAREGTQCLPAPQVLPPPEGGSAGVPILVKALATSDDGRIVVGQQGIGSDDTEAVIWIDRTPHYLKDYLRANGIPDAFQRWFKTGSLTGVTPDGRILVGQGPALGGFNSYMVILGEQP